MGGDSCHAAMVPEWVSLLKFIQAPTSTGCLPFPTFQFFFFLLFWGVGGGGALTIGDTELPAPVKVGVINMEFGGCRGDKLWPNLKPNLSKRSTPADVVYPT